MDEELYALIHKWFDTECICYRCTYDIGNAPTHEHIQIKLKELKKVLKNVNS